MNQIEAVANVIEDMMQQHEVGREFDSHGWGEKILSAAFTAQVGCEQCVGTGRQVQVLTRPLEDVPIAMPTAIEGPCPAEHVKLDNPFGGVVYADPAKCEWRCEDEFYGSACFATATVGELRAVTTEFRTHSACRWVPRLLEVTE